MKSMVHDLCYHIVLGTEDQRPLISPGLKIGLYALFAEVVEGRNGVLRGVGGIPNHVHLLVRLPPSELVSDMVAALKTESVQWVDGLHGNELGWEEGYGVFSVSKAQAPSVLALLEDQERHHVRRSYTYELLRLINGHDQETTGLRGEILVPPAPSWSTSKTTI
ncbi:MAG: transposase [Acidobacteria bacterium]|nr:transposase [Candidatus Sulfomarinibacter kjeldsenii]